MGSQSTLLEALMIGAFVFVTACLGVGLILVAIASPDDSEAAFVGVFLLALAWVASS